MSQEIREKALSAAVALGGDAKTVVANASAFEAFLSGKTAAEPKPTKPTPEKAQPVAAKPAEKAKPVAAKPAPKKDEVDPDAKKLCGDKVNELLKANKREEAVALLASFDGAQSASGIVAQGDEVIQAFLTQADELLSARKAVRWPINRVPPARR